MAKTLYGDVFSKGGKDKVDGKEKGNRNELVVAKLLSKWTGVEFNRTPASGGLRWVEASRISGDVVAPIDFNFIFSVETKSYADILLVGKLRNNARVFTFWEQCMRDALRADKEPLMLLRRNGMPKATYVIYTNEVVGHVLLALGLTPVAWTDPIMAIDPDIPWVYGFGSVEFFNVEYKQLIENYGKSKQ